MLAWLKFQCSHPTWKTLKTWNFIIFFSRPGKCLEVAQKVVKTCNCNTNPGKNLKFANSMFLASFKVLFTKIILIYLIVISTLSTQTLIRSQIDLGFHCFYLEITWKIHGFFVWPDKLEPCICFNTFWDFYNYNLYESTCKLTQFFV